MPNTIIYSMLVLFITCWGRNLSIQAGVGKLNGNLHQPSRIRYELRAFSVRYLVSLAYRKWLISGVKLSVVVPQAIGISLCNKPIQWSLQCLTKGGLQIFSKLNIIRILCPASAINPPSISMRKMIYNPWIWIHADRQWTPNVIGQNILKFHSHPDR